MPSGFLVGYFEWAWWNIQLLYIPIWWKLLVIFLVPHWVSERKLYCSLLAVTRVYWERFLQGFKYDKRALVRVFFFIVPTGNFVHDEGKRGSELRVHIDPAIKRGFWGFKIPFWWWPNWKVRKETILFNFLKLFLNYSCPHFSPTTLPCPMHPHLLHSIPPHDGFVHVSFIHVLSVTVCLCVYVCNCVCAYTNFHKTQRKKSFIDFSSTLPLAAYLQDICLV